MLRKVEDKALKVVQDAYGNASDGDAERNYRFAINLVKTLEKNDIIMVDLGVFDEMADLCGPAMDDIYCPELCDHSWHDEE